MSPSQARCSGMAARLRVKLSPIVVEARPVFTVGLCVLARFAVRFCVSGVYERSESARQ